MKVRPIRIEGNFAYIPLTRGYESVIDATDVNLVEGFNWYALTIKQNVYAYRNALIDGERSLVSIHRTIMGNPNGMQVDHKDCDGLNNTKSNLRIATHQQNNFNRRLTSKNTSGLKGVYWSKEMNKWRAQIGVYGKNVNLGYFETKEAAHIKYCEFSRKLHGEFGRTE